MFTMKDSTKYIHVGVTTLHVWTDERTSDFVSDTYANIKVHCGLVISGALWEEGGDGEMWELGSTNQLLSQRRILAPSLPGTQISIP